MKPGTTLALCASLFSLALLAEEPDANLVKNGGFEDPAAKNTGKWWIADVWARKNGAKPEDVGRFQLDPFEAGEGRLSQQVATISAEGYPAVFTYVELLKGHRYKLSFKMKQSGMAGSPYLLFRPSVRGFGNYIGAPDWKGQSLAPGETWTDFAFEFDAKLDDPKAQLIFLSYGESGIFWVDDVKLLDSGASK
jgi:hypothetical protein